MVMPPQFPFEIKETFIDSTHATGALGGSNMGPTRK